MPQMIKLIERYGLTETYDRLYANSKNKDNFNKIMDIVKLEDNIRLAYHVIKYNKGSKTPGPNGRTIKEIAIMSEQDVIGLVLGILNNYKITKYKSVEIPKTNGKTRIIKIANIENRIAEQAIKQVLEPIMEVKFYKHSYGFRPNRNAQHALARTVSMINRGKMYYVLKFDIEDFFNNIDHKKLNKIMYNYGVHDKQLLAVLNTIMQSNGKSGIAQGSVIAPLLANVYLTELDKWVSTQWENFPLDGDKNIHSWHNGTGKRTKLKSGYIVRYADDFVIMCRNHNHAKRFQFAIIRYLENNLKLKVNVDKSKLYNTKNKSFEFLGFDIKTIAKGNTKNGYVAQTNINENKLKNIQQDLKKKIKRIQYNSYDNNNCINYNVTVMGIKNYFKYATHVYLDLDKLGISIYKTIKVRLRDRSTTNIFANMDQGYRSVNPGIQNTTRIYEVNGIPLHIINGIKHENPKQLRNGTCRYTKNGRLIIEYETGDDSLINNMQHIFIKSKGSDSIEYNSNRITLYYARKGKCVVTGEFLSSDTYHCHHKLPRKYSGTDHYRNLEIVSSDVHKLIHATDDVIIQKYLKILKLNEKQKEKLNKYRKLAKVKIIEFE